MQTPRRARAAPRDVAVPAGWGFDDHQAPDETETPGGWPASPCLNQQGADGGGGDDDDEGGCGTRPHCDAAVGSSCAEGPEVGGGDQSDEKGRGEAHDHQRTILKGRR